MVPYKILLVGGSGKGKTKSFEHMDRDKTAFINIERKPYPFPGKFRIEAAPKTTVEIFNLMDKASETTSINCIIFDSFSSFLDINMKESRRDFKGWDIMNNYNANIAKFNERIKDLPIDAFVTAHYEYVGDELTGMKERRVKSKGKEWEGMVEKDYTVVLYTEARIVDPSKPAQHYFRLTTDGTNSAKTPPGIFGPEVVEVPNDSRIVFDKIQDFKNIKV